MVNKVDGNNYYIYTKQKKIDVPDTDEKFSLGYQKNESSPDTKDKKEIAEPEKRQAAERSGVSLELSANAQDAGTDRQKRTEEETQKAQNAFGQFPLLETIKTYVMAAMAAVRDFFDRFWNGQPQDEILEAELLEEIPQDVQMPEESTQDMPLLEENLPGVLLLEETLQESAEIIDTRDEKSVSSVEEERRNREIQQSLREGDMEHVISLLTDNGRKTIARNSTLLSSYDKNGRVVEPDASVRERILYGDKNTWKL